ncbi:MAG: radical SAM protein [Desulfobacterales bacterium]|nr:radical SAM protein [Desulfobacterales bacterium]
MFHSFLCADDPVHAGKQALYLTQNRGAFIRDCPGTRAYQCCGYKILHIGSFCNMDCSYCILQSYFHPPLLQYFVNKNDLLKELEGVFAEKTVSRVGTGEFTDSLIWDAWSDLNRRLIEKFSAQRHAVLELKTKTIAIDRLKRLRHNRKTIISWSLNSPGIIRSEERRTAPLTARLKAAATCQDWGYPLGFHLDPLIIYDGCQNDYRQVIEQLFSYVSAENIAWISMGSFRFMPALKPIVHKRFPDSKIIYGEFISGLDAKMRYFQPLRIELYRKVVGWIRARAPQAMIYLCMESDAVWKQSFGFIPSERGGLAQMLDASAVKLCNLSVS